MVIAVGNDGLKTFSGVIAHSNLKEGHVNTGDYPNPANLDQAAINTHAGLHRTVDNVNAEAARALQSSQASTMSKAAQLAAAHASGVAAGWPAVTSGEPPATGEQKKGFTNPFAKRGGTPSK
ncbi:MAG: hypothetical protein EBR02_09635 [Alphaproteobacteria bacterium]|nr:hypothetical protein [Alphaproteobacteria bacterium]